jgi:hypothetical protein
MWLAASVAGWVAVAGFLSVTAAIDENSMHAIDSVFRDLVRFAAILVPIP